MVDLSALPPPEPPQPAPEVAVYEPVSGGRWFTFVIIAIFFVLTVLLVSETVDGGPDAPPRWFAALWVVGMTGNVYWWLWRIVSRLELSGGTVRWSTPIRSGEVPVTELVAVRPRSGGMVLEHERGRITVMYSKGFEPFAEALHAARPDLPVRVRWRPGAARTPTPAGIARDRFPWWSLLVFALPIGAFVLFVTLWKPGVDPIVDTGGGPFFVGTIIRDGTISIGPPTRTLDEPPDHVLAAACHNYFHWLDDVTLRPDIVILEPSNGMLRSAELLDGGGFSPTETILEAERLAFDGLSPEAIDDELADDGVSAADREEVGAYLEARVAPASPGAGERYVFYLAPVTARSVVVARLEVDVDAEIRPSAGSRTGDLSVVLPDDDTIWGIPEVACRE